MRYHHQYLLLQAHSHPHKAGLSQDGKDEKVFHININIQGIIVEEIQIGRDNCELVVESL